MVSQATLGSVYHYATRPRRARFNQLAYLRTVKAWRSEGRFEALEDATSDDPALAFDVSWRREGVGANGYPNGFELTYRIDSEFVDGDPDEAAFDALNEFGAALVEALYDAIESDCPEALSVRQYGVLVASRTASEAALADAFDLETGAVDALVAAAEATAESSASPRLAASLEHYPALEGPSFAITTDLVDSVREPELPVEMTDSGYVSHAPESDP